MALIGFDADQNVAPHAAKAISGGACLFFRYLKNLTAAEISQIFSEGRVAAVSIGLITIFEAAAERALGGAEVGTADAAEAVQMARALQQPAGTVIVGTADFDEQALQDPQVSAYFTAFFSGIKPYRSMIYANGAICAELKAAGIVEFTWVTGGKAMRGTQDELASGAEDVQQDVGDKRGLNLGIDIDTDYAPRASAPSDLGAWTAGTGALSASAGAPVQVAPPIAGMPTVQALQQGLVGSGAAVAVDGVWGPETEAAVGKYYSERSSS